MPVGHEDECEAAAYEGATCTCDLLREYGSAEEFTAYGADDCEPSAYDGRVAGPSLDW